MFLKLALAALMAMMPKTPSASADLHRRQVVAIGETLSLTDAALSVRVEWDDCDDENAAYDPLTDSVVLCNENELDPGWSVFAAAHEAGHAVVQHLNLPVDESTWGNEVAADELAAIALIHNGDLTDIVDAAEFHAKDLSVVEDDPHPPGPARAFHLMCLATGSTAEGSPYCKTLYRQVDAKWTIAIAQADGTLD
jgi:hypothetical protein